MTTPIDEYLKKVTPSQKVALERVRRIVKAIVPDAEEVISYGMPTLKYKGAYLIYFAAYKDHMSIHGNVSELEGELKEFNLSHRGTVQFTEEHEIPEEVIAQIVHNRLKEIG